MPINEPSPTPLDEHLAADVAELFRAFSDTSRVRIISAIIDQELNVNAIAEKLEMSESAISHHLRILRQMKMVEVRRDGKEVYYRLVDEHIIAFIRQGVSHALHG